MSFSISETTKITQIPITTIRYYEKIGLLSDIERKSGVRSFTESDIATLRVIKVVKSCGMPLHEIKLFLMNDANRLALSLDRLKSIEEQIFVLNQIYLKVKKICLFYEKVKMQSDIQI